ncbi:hypothetical protein LY76DRAFT_608688 [Colletotrichum caudatum]|nr:hypothetical protein LY76DRAFT_608688 [Colletotrichum caudatum]
MAGGPQYIYTSLRFNRINEPRDNPDARVCRLEAMAQHGMAAAFRSSVVVGNVTTVGNDQGMRPDNMTGKCAVMTGTGLESFDPEGREKEMGGRTLHSPFRPNDYDPPSTSPEKQLPAVQTDYVSVKHASGSPSLRVSPPIDHSTSERKFAKFRP